MRFFWNALEKEGETGKIYLACVEFESDLDKTELMKSKDKLFSVAIPTHIPLSREYKIGS